MGEQLLKFWEWLLNAAQQAAIAEAPAVLTAAGQKINRNTGKVEYNHANDEGVKQLRSNLAAIGDAGLSAPGVAEAIELGYNVVRHPKQTYKAVKHAVSYLRKTPKPRKPTYKITEENAASITPEQWTAAQDAAIARGDMVEAQRLRDLHFKVSAPNTKVIDEKGNPLTMYHGTTPVGNYILRHNGVQYKPNGLDMFFTSDYYGQYLGGSNTKSVPVYINAKRIGIPGNNYEIGSAKPSKYLKKDQDALYEWGSLKNNDFATDEAFEAAQNTIFPKEASWAKSKGFDLDNIDEVNVPRFLKVLEEDINTRGIGHHPIEEFAVPKGEQVKLADAVTYGGDGVRIPLGKRDNFNINDTRYALFPFIGGGIGYGLYNTFDQ